MKNKRTEKLKDTEAICLITLLAMNILLLVAVGQIIWLAYSFLSNKNFLESIVFGNFLP